MSSFPYSFFSSLGLDAIDLDLTISKYDPSTFTCFGLIAPCCIATAGSGICGGIQMPFNSVTSNDVEQGYFNTVEKAAAAGPDVAYLIYVNLIQTPTNLLLKQSRAQVKMYSRVSGRNVETFFTLTATTAEMNNNLFTPKYWVVTCMVRGAVGAVTYKSLVNPINNVTSILTNVLPNVTTYCT